MCLVIKRMTAFFIVLFLLTISATAQPVINGAGTITIEGTDAYTNEHVSMTAELIHLLGKGVDGGYVVYARSRFVRVSERSLRDILPKLSTADLPDERNIETVGTRTKGDTTLALQDALVELGFLSGRQDGYAGSRTVRAIKELQRSLEMEETGTADPLFVMLVLSLTQKTEVITVDSTAQESFKEIWSRTDADLDAIYEDGLRLEYDDISGKGFLSDDKKYSFDMSGESDIELMKIDFSLGISTCDADDGKTDLKPQVFIDCLCVRRPMINEMIIKSGADRVIITPSSTNSILSGTNTVEKLVFNADSDIAKMLFECVQKEELKVRLTGSYDQYDLIFDKADLEFISKSGDAMLKASSIQ